MQYLFENATKQMTNIQKYVRVGCKIKTLYGVYEVERIPNNEYVITTGSINITDGVITEVFDYKIPDSIEQDKYYVGGYVKLTNQSNEFVDYRNNVWAKITLIDISSSSLAIQIQYLDTNKYSRIKKHNIGVYNPFSPDDKIILKDITAPTLNTTVGVINYGQMLADCANKAVQDFKQEKINIDALLINQNITLDQYN